MDHVPLLIPGLLISFCMLAAVWTVVRMRRLRDAWSSGITTEGRCVGAYVVTRGGHGRGTSRTHYHHFEFRTPDGAAIRFKEPGGSPRLLPGHTVTVRYPHGRPDRATALPPSHGRARVETVVVLGLLSLIAAACAVFMAVYESDLRDGKPTESTQDDQLPLTPPPLPTAQPTGFPSHRLPLTPLPLPTAPPADFPTDLSGLPELGSQSQYR
ncbi:DUF3592 domain-containing protein [Streptomyces sp. NPDC085524]|uniref:DUF3592 domain-containing protein n=1 Tax=Streptomyces sp. NPDC085524 TaxID=3365728 RepID=UPI0037D8F4FF